jgi:iron-sulfur cluster assembly accessory protein
MSTTTEPVITLTERAAKYIASEREEAITKHGLGQENLFRISVGSGGCSGLSYEMGFEKRQDSDREMEQHGVKFLADEMSLTYLKGCTIDYVDGLTGRGLRIINPNARHTCGCGTSFEA